MIIFIPVLTADYILSFPGSPASYSYGNISKDVTFTSLSVSLWIKAYVTMAPVTIFSYSNMLHPRAFSLLHSPSSGYVLLRTHTHCNHYIGGYSDDLIEYARVILVLNGV